jgi:hypothetical protein
MAFVQLGKMNVDEQIISDSNLTTKHVFTISELQPSTRYYYRVISGDTSKIFKFQTLIENNSPFTFIAYGDTRSQHNVHLSVVQKMSEFDALFALHTGDNVGNGTNLEHWKIYFDIICNQSNFGCNVPIFYTMGNHERNASHWYDYFEMPHNNPEKNETFYSFNCNEAHFVCLNTYIPYDTGSVQYSWLLQDLENSKKMKWKFVFFHSPPFSSGSGHGSDIKVRNAFHPVFQYYNITMVFNGHDHTYERTNSLGGVTYVVTGGGGAPLYSLNNNPWTANKESSYHFCLILVDTNYVFFKMIRTDGIVGDSLRILSTNIFGH